MAGYYKENYVVTHQIANLQADINNRRSENGRLLSARSASKSEKQKLTQKRDQYKKASIELNNLVNETILDQAKWAIEDAYKVFKHGYDGAHAKTLYVGFEKILAEIEQIKSHTGSILQKIWKKRDEIDKKILKADADIQQYTNKLNSNSQMIVAHNNTIEQLKWQQWEWIEYNQ